MQARQRLLIIVVGALGALALAAGVGATGGAPTCPVDDNGQCISDQQAYYADSPAEVGTPTQDLSFDGVSRCWWVPASHSKGTLMYTRKVIMVVKWCARNGAITTYAVQAVYGSTGLLCSWNNPLHYTVAGGVGASYVIIHGQVSATCDTPWWFHLHDNVWMEVRYGSQGVASIVASG